MFINHLQPYQFTQCLFHRSGKMPRGVAFHIHQCFVKMKQEEADAVLAASYMAVQCHWKNCVDAAKTWPSQKEFVDHVQRHVHQALACGWIDCADTPCHDDKVQDWHRHLSRCHSVSIHNRAAVHYCYICFEW